MMTKQHSSLLFQMLKGKKKNPFISWCVPGTAQGRTMQVGNVPLGLILLLPPLKEPFLHIFLSRKSCMTTIRQNKMGKKKIPYRSPPYKNKPQLTFTKNFIYNSTETTFKSNKCQRIGTTLGIRAGATKLLPLTCSNTTQLGEISLQDAAEGRLCLSPLALRVTTKQFPCTPVSPLASQSCTNSLLWALGAELPPELPQFLLWATQTLSSLLFPLQVPSSGVLDGLVIIPPLHLPCRAVCDSFWGERREKK